MPEKLTIAIDGPAASGKSTLALALSKELGYLFFDTGVIYRAVTLAALQRGIDLSDAAALEKLAAEITIDVNPPSVADGRPTDVLLNGEDCTWDIRTHPVDQNVSVVSAYPGVRAALIEQQRRIGTRGGVVMVGRDIGTVVLPEADLKIYLDASVEERARRRHVELQARGVDTSYEDVEKNLRKRDRIDANRDVAPLRAADDAVILISDGHTAAETLAEVHKLVELAQAEPGRGA